MSQNMPLLTRVLGTAALASVIVVLLMARSGNEWPEYTKMEPPALRPPVVVLVAEVAEVAVV